MHVHLLSVKSADSLSSQLGHIKLRLCLTILGAIGTTCASASVFRGVFLEALRQTLLRNPGVAAAEWHNAIANPAIETESRLAPDSALFDIDANFFANLMDDASILHLWEGLNSADF